MSNGDLLKDRQRYTENIAKWEAERKELNKRLFDIRQELMDLDGKPKTDDREARKLELLNETESSQNRVTSLTQWINGEKEALEAAEEQIARIDSQDQQR